MRLSLIKSTSTYSTDSLKGASFLVTGGTGSFGKRFIEIILERFSPKRLVVFSRDELKQFEMEQQFPMTKFPCMRYFIGDVRDKERLKRACFEVDYIIHAAAMKHITAAEYNPTECIATNVDGAKNLIDAAINNNVKRVVALSTDKAANPINLYGATKLASDKLFVAANNLAGHHQTRFSVVRYGNVAGSRGSVIPFFKKLVSQGREELPVTHEEMTRFIISLDLGVEYVLRALSTSFGGEIYVPKLPSLKVVDLVKALLPSSNYRITGIRPGEKLHEVMIPLEESRNCVDMGDHYIIQPTHSWWNTKAFEAHIKGAGKQIENPFEYESGGNDWWLDEEEIQQLVDSIDPA